MNHLGKPSSVAAFVVGCALAVAFAAPAIAKPTPSPAPIVVCEPAFFYVWPDRSSAPTRTAYPPARIGDGFDVIGDGTLAYVGLTLYETTIDVYSPFGAGKHYWVSTECVNAG
jgi:hypothetical protein